MGRYRLNASQHLPLRKGSGTAHRDSVITCYYPNDGRNSDLGGHILPTYLNNLPLSFGISTMLMPIDLVSKGHIRVHKWCTLGDRGALEFDEGFNRRQENISEHWGCIWDILGASISFHILWNHFSIVNIFTIAHTKFTGQGRLDSPQISLTVVVGCSRDVLIL